MAILGEFPGTLHAYRRYTYHSVCFSLLNLSFLIQRRVSAKNLEGQRGKFSFLPTKSYLSLSEPTQSLIVWNLKGFLGPECVSGKSLSHPLQRCLSSHTVTPWHMGRHNPVDSEALSS